ncbi:hypothetical protein TSOC_013576, partial [Tetrabaena socialis]
MPYGQRHDEVKEGEVRVHVERKAVCADGALPANRCVLSRASPVLRHSLLLELSVPGELSLPGDCAASWGVVLQLLSLEAYPLALVNA